MRAVILKFSMRGNLSMLTSGKHFIKQRLNRLTKIKHSQLASDGAVPEELKPHLKNSRMLRMQNWCRLKALINVMESDRGAEGRVVNEYWHQDRLVSFDTIATTTGLFMGRRERKKAPNKTQTKYTGLDIP